MAHPDRVANVQASVRVGSAMDEFAFSLALRHLVSKAPGLPVMHVPPQLSVVWQMNAPPVPAPGSSAAAAAGARSQLAPCHMADWFREHRAQLLDARYLALHWCSGHFCSIIVDLQVWRTGPLGGLDSASAADVAPAPASSEAAIAHPPRLSSSSSPPMTEKRTRRPSRALQAAQEDTRSTSRTLVPLLHLDTLPSACGFTADKRALLRRICVELNSLFGTAWPVRLQRDLDARLHLCGPEEQPDGWSCGYRLLHAWERIFRSMRSPPAAASPMPVWSLTPVVLNDLCGHELPDGSSDVALVERVRAWRDAATMVRASAQRPRERTVGGGGKLNTESLMIAVRLCVRHQRAEDVVVDPSPVLHPPASSSSQAEAID